MVGGKGEGGFSGTISLPSTIRQRSYLRRALSFAPLPRITPLAMVKLQNLNWRHTHSRAHTRKHTHTHLRAHTHIHTHIRTQTKTYIQAHAHMHTSAHTPPAPTPRGCPAACRRRPPQRAGAPASWAARGPWEGRGPGVRSTPAVRGGARARNKCKRLYSSRARGRVHKLYRRTGSLPGAWALARWPPAQPSPCAAPGGTHRSKCCSPGPGSTPAGSGGARGPAARRPGCAQERARRGQCWGVLQGGQRCRSEHTAPQGAPSAPHAPPQHAQAPAARARARAHLATCRSSRVTTSAA